MSAVSEQTRLYRGPLEVERRGGALRVTLNRPEALNSVSPAMVDALEAVCAEVERDASVRCLLIRGSGSSFCAGGDLKATVEIRDRGAGEAGRYFAALSAAFTRLERLPVPTVAVVHGWAVAGGLELALCCDLVVAATTARFGDAHSRYGLVPGGGGSVRLPRRIGVGRAKWLMFTGESVDAETMRDWGVVSEVVPEPELDAAADRLVSTLTARSRAGLAAMKQLVDEGMQLPVPDALALENAVCGRHVESPDAVEGMAAFAQRRAPRFAP